MLSICPGWGPSAIRQRFRRVLLGGPMLQAELESNRLVQRRRKPTLLGSLIPKKAEDRGIWIWWGEFRVPE